MGALSGTWVIKAADPVIGLYGLDDPPPSILRIDGAETEVEGVHRVDWEGSPWTLTDYSETDRPWLTKSADITLGGAPHRALFGIFPDGTANLNVEVEELVEENKLQPTGSARGMK